MSSYCRRLRSFSEGSNLATSSNNLIAIQNDPAISAAPPIAPVSTISTKQNGDATPSVKSPTTITSPFTELPIYKRLRSLSEICLPLPPATSPHDKHADTQNPPKLVSENSPISLPPLVEQPQLAVTSTTKPPLAPTAAPVSWIWSWGSLPVKSKIPSSADLKAMTENSQRPAVEETSPPVQLSSLSPHIAPTTEPSDILQNYLKQQMERAQSFEDIRLGNYGADALPPILEAIPEHSNTSIHPEDVCESKIGPEAKLFSHHDEINRSVSPAPLSSQNILVEDLAYDHSSFDFAFDAVDSARDRTRMVLSQCGHILSEHRTAPEPAPLTVEQLLRVLYSYRVTKNDLQQLHHQAVRSDQDAMTLSVHMLLQNPNLVVVLGGTLYNSKDAEVVIDRHLVKQYFPQSSTSSLRSIVFSMFNEALEKDFHEVPGGEVGLRASHSFVSCNIPGPLSLAMKSRNNNNSLSSLSTLGAVSEVGLPLSQDSLPDSLNTLQGSSSNLELQCSDTWSGKRILSWKTTDVVDDSAALKACDDIDGGSFEPFLVNESHEADFVNWSQKELGWRSSFTDLMQAYASQRLEKLNSPCDNVSLKRSCSSQMEFKYSNDSFSVKNEDSGLPSFQLIESAENCSETITKAEEEEGEEMIVDATIIESINSQQELAIIPIMATPPEVEIETDNDHISLEDIALDEISLEPNRGDYNDSDTDSYLSLSLEDGESGSLTSGDRESHRGRDRYRFGDPENSSYLQQYRQQTQRRYRYRKVLIPSQEQLEMLDLQDGLNEIEFELEGFPPLRSHLFVWPDNAKVVVTEIEGVIKNCVASSKQQQSMKAWVPFLGGGASTPNSIVCFDGSIEIFNDLTSKGYQIIYLTRDGQDISSFNSLGGTGKERQINASKAYLSTFTVPVIGSPIAVPPKSRSLPIGPILRSPESLVRGTNWNINSLVFRSAALRGVRNLFPANHNPYHACFATNESDMVRSSKLHNFFSPCNIDPWLFVFQVAFSRFGFPDGRIFSVSGKGHIRCYNRASVVTSFRDLSELSNEIFPEIVNSECNYLWFNF